MAIYSGFSMKSFHNIIVIIVVLLCLFGIDGIAATPPSITTLKNLHLTTSFVDRALAKAVIVIPNTKYNTEASILNATFFSHTGVLLPILYDTNVDPETLLQTYNVIAIGNRESNTFIYELYRQGYTFLDSKYPGAGGYVVRSLHNPFASGKNVIFVGGSDDSGVGSAASWFNTYLDTGSNAYSVGRIMQIHLSTAVQATLPVIGTDISVNLPMSSWNVHTWNDSFRTIDGISVGYPSGTYYGWNPISIAGALYYMTGQTSYLNLFKQIAMPDINNIPVINRNCEAFYDPADPLVKNYHYLAHKVDLVFDLIEESPEFSNAERLFITDKLAKHQYEYKYGADGQAYDSSTRHGLYHSLCVYTGSRYFKKYYPASYWDASLSWDTPINDVRTKFNNLLNNATWGESDTLEWVCTCIEPVLDFFMMDGFTTFRDSGTAAWYMTGLDVLWRGNAIDDFHEYNSISVYNKAAEITHLGTPIWLRNRLNYDYSVFRIGQSWWPSGLTATEPTAGVISISRLATTDWNSANADLLPSRQTSLSESYQILSYRTDVCYPNKDDYILLDGYNGSGRNEYNLNSILKLRMFGGKDILTGLHSDVDILVDGMTNNQPGKCAALKNKLEGSNTMYLRSDVPNMKSSTWQRHLLMLKDKAFITIDKITATETENFTIQIAWEFGPSINTIDEERKLVNLSNGVTMSHTGKYIISQNGNIINENSTGYLPSGSVKMAGNVISLSSDPFRILEINGSENAFLLENNSGERAFVALGAYTGANFSVNADFVYFDDQKVVLANAQSFIVNGQQVVVSAPMTDVISMNMSTALTMLETIDSSPSYPIVLRDTWKPDWQLYLNGGKITHIINAGVTHAGNFWLINSTDSTSNAFLLDVDSESISQTLNLESTIYSLNVAQNSTQANAFALLLGTKDDHIMAYDSQGNMTWSKQMIIDPSFVMGDSYYAPWFTSPDAPYNNTGVYSIAIGNFRGQGDEIAAGRPCTIEYRNLSGSLIQRLPTEWGNNHRLCNLTTTNQANQMLLVAKHYAGYPSVTGITDSLSIISNKLFASLPPDCFAMGSGWLQKDCGDMQVVDLDNDGVQEVIIVLIGSWNELRVYNGQTGHIKWLKYFGAGAIQEALKHNLNITDIDGDGYKDILVSPNNNSMFAFNSNGNLIWRVEFSATICSFDVQGAVNKTIAVGLENGYVANLNATGELVCSGKIDNYPVRVICAFDKGFICGSDNGRITVFPVTMPYDLLSNWYCDNLSNSSLTDSTILSNDGAVIGNVLLNDIGVVGKSIEFTASDQYVTIPHNQAYSFDEEVTVSVWLNPTSYPTSNWSIFFNKTAYSGGLWNGMYLCLESNGLVRLVSDAAFLYSTVSIPLGEWSHVVCTINSNECRIYINGELAGSTPTSASYNLNNSNPIYLGIYKPNDPYNYFGKMDEIRVYDSCLSEGEVWWLYHDVSLLGEWKCDSLGNNTALDETLRENDGIASDVKLAADSISSNSFSFTASDQYVTIPHNQAYSFDEEVTVSVWLNPTSYPTSNWSIFFNKTAYSGGLWNGMYLCLESNGLVRLVSDAAFLYSTVSIPLGEWSHVVCTINSNECRIYINGELAGSTPTSASYNLNNSNPIYLGIYKPNDPYNYFGKMDEIQIYNKSLSADLINQLHKDKLLLADWHCDTLENDAIEDSSSTSNDGFAYNGTTLSIDSRLGSALSFDGLNDYVQIPHHKAYVFDREETISLWLKVDSWPDSMRIFLSKIDYGGGAWPGIYLALNPDGRLRLVSSAAIFNSTSSVSAGEWVHVVCTINETACKFYINGVESGSSASTNGYQLNNTKPLYLGAYTPTSYHFPGKIDEIKIYRYSLSADEVASIYLNP